MHEIGLHQSLSFAASPATMAFAYWELSSSPKASVGGLKKHNQLNHFRCTSPSLLFHIWILRKCWDMLGCIPYVLHMYQRGTLEILGPVKVFMGNLATCSKLKAWPTASRHSWSWSNSAAVIDHKMKPPNLLSNYISIKRIREKSSMQSGNTCSCACVMIATSLVCLGHMRKRQCQSR